MTTVADLPPLPALVVGEVRHLRVRPLRHAFAYRHFHWLVDLDAPPRLAWPLRVFAGFANRDHLDARESTIKAALLSLLAQHQISLGHGGRAVMLAHPRQLGHVFNPLTVYWCFDSAGALAATVYEVHNTYGQRHSYVLRPDDTGMDKRFYVSPFNDLRGRYAVRSTLSPEAVTVSIDLYRDDALVLAASVAGVPQPATALSLLRQLLRTPAMTLRVSTLIRWHGLRLWRRLPIQPRPDQLPEALR